MRNPYSILAAGLMLAVGIGAALLSITGCASAPDQAQTAYSIAVAYQAAAQGEIAYIKTDNPPADVLADIKLADQAAYDAVTKMDVAAQSGDSIALAAAISAAQTAVAVLTSKTTGAK